jgi:hypothetical protein
MNQLSRRARLGGIVAVLTGMLLPGTGTADTIRPLAPGETAYGLTLTQWATAWFQWNFSMANRGDPGSDKTGVQSGIGQHLPVWFLPRLPANQSTTRIIYVPDGCAILFAGVNTIEAGNPPGGYSEDDWVTDERGSWDALLSGLKTYEVSMDDVAIPDVEQYRVHTPLFTVVVPPEGVMGFNVQAGKDNRAVAIGDGDFMLMSPLPIGKHIVTVHRAGINRAGASYDTKGVYNLIIQEPNKPAE